MILACPSPWHRLHLSERKYAYAHAHARVCACSDSVMITQPSVFGVRMRSQNQHFASGKSSVGSKKWWHSAVVCCSSKQQVLTVFPRYILSNKSEYNIEWRQAAIPIHLCHYLAIQ